ncbi:unnamed protein product [Medioppia subpectinata]|uniref:C2H2-type domain-containing protein n=1 Tax=Medioppia subpectinata TaxID=1979941 RepID=A0A7R9KSM6_9ACAR|nr:unnamed protein product [Medioppia subpectinata]CAG2107709.1 unnamed protein product [Medioppia subpectinata]
MENEKEGFPITALREIKILQLLKHDNVVPLYEICRTQSRSDQTSAATAVDCGVDTFLVTYELVLSNMAVAASAAVDQLWTTTTGGAITVVVTDGQHLTNPDAYLCGGADGMDIEVNGLTDDTCVVHNVLIAANDGGVGVGTGGAADTPTVPKAAKRKIQTKKLKVNTVTDGEKKFQCSWTGCLYGTNNRGNFQKHYRIHTGEKPYKCTHDGCQYSCSDPARFRENKLIHSTEKGYVCG